MLHDEKPAHKLKGRFARLVESDAAAAAVAGAGVFGPWCQYLHGRLFLQRWPGEKVGRLEGLGRGGLSWWWVVKWGRRSGRR